MHYFIPFMLNVQQVLASIIQASSCLKKAVLNWAP